MNAFLNSFPLIPFVHISLSIAGFVPALFLVFIARKAPLHSNCRFFLFGWVSGLCSMFCTIIAVDVMNLLEEDGYMGTALFKPPMRYNLYGVITGVSVFCSSFELAIAFERIISSVRPQKYHRSPLAKRQLLLVTATIICLSLLEFTIQHAGYYETCGFVMMGMDLSTVIVNSIAVRYCRRRYLNLHGWLSLNERYQIKEAYEMSRAMQPVLVTVLFFKCIIILSSDIVFYLSTFGNYAVGYNEAVYLFVTAVYGNCVTTMLIRKHPALRRQAEHILCKKEQQQSIQILPEADTESHFDYLKNEWKL